jgi:hypothetical protein
MSTQTKQEQTEAAPQQITVDDIALIVNIIATASRRGAFEAAEFTVVGGLFEKLKDFLPEPVAAEDNAAESTNTGADAETETPANQLNFDFAGQAQKADEDTSEG